MLELERGFILLSFQNDHIPHFLDVNILSLLFTRPGVEELHLNQEILMDLVHQNLECLKHPL